MSEHYEQYKHTRTWVSWLILATFSASIVGWAIFLRSTVRDPPRRWDFGQREDTPAETFATTEEPDRDLPVLRQIAPWPGSDADGAPSGEGR